MSYMIQIIWRYKLYLDWLAPEAQGAEMQQKGGIAIQFILDIS